MSLELAHFDLYSLTLETRFTPSYHIWDRAGFITTELLTMFPNAKVESAAPSNIVFNIDRKCQFTIGTERTAISAFPKAGFKIEEMTSIAGKLVPFIQDVLELKNYTRIGLRPIFTKTYDSKQEASEAMSATGMLKLPTGKHFNIEGKVVMPHYALRWEDDDLGLTVNLRAQERSIRADAPMGETATSSVDLDIYEIILDFDYYTLSNVTAEKFNAEEWISQSMRLIRRDSNIFLGA